MKAPEARAHMTECLRLMSRSHKDPLRARIMGAVYQGFSNIILSAEHARYIYLPNAAQIKDLEADGYRVDQYPPDAKPDQPRKMIISW